MTIFCLFDTIFSGIIWIYKLHYFHEEICLPNTGCHGSRKKQFTRYHSSGCYEEEKPHRILESYRFKLPLKKVDWISAR